MEEHTRLSTYRLTTKAILVSFNVREGQNVNGGIRLSTRLMGKSQSEFDFVRDSISIASTLDALPRHSWANAYGSTSSLEGIHIE